MNGPQNADTVLSVCTIHCYKIALSIGVDSMSHVPSGTGDANIDAPTPSFCLLLAFVHILCWYNAVIAFFLSLTVREKLELRLMLSNWEGVRSQSLRIRSFMFNYTVR